MGGFLRYSLIGLKDWWVKSKVIAESSVDKALEGRHYSKGTRIHKQSFEAILRFKIRMIEENYPAEFLTKLMKLRKDATYENNILGIKNKLFDDSGTMGSWVTDYLRDISTFYLKLPLTGTKAWTCVCRHSATYFLCYLLLIIPIILGIWHVTILNLKDLRKQILVLIKNWRCMGASLTGRKCSTIPGDLVTETTVNREVKIRGGGGGGGGAMRGGYSTSQEAVNNFVMNTHVLAKLRRALKEKMDLNTSCLHKEFTHGQMKLHENYIQNLLASLHTDPLHGPARNIFSGYLINLLIICFQRRMLAKNL